MANISVSLNLQAYEGFKFLSQKDAQGNKEYYAAIPVKTLFNPAGTKKIYATAIMIPTPNSKYSDFMLKPMCSSKELQSMTQDDFRALPVLGTCKYMEQAVSRDIVKDAAKSAVVDEEDLDDVFGMQGGAQSDPNAQPQNSNPLVNPTQLPDTPTSLYYVTDNNQVIVTARTLADVLPLYKAQASPSVMLTKYEGNAVVGVWSKANILQFGL